MKNLRKSQGFTLIEIMVVIVILGVLGAMVVPSILGKTGEARIKAAKSDLRTIETALDMYRMDNFVYPSSEQGLQALVTKPSGFPEAKNWNEPYLKREAKDPWGNLYQYISPGSAGAYDLFSLGADGKPGGEGEAADLFASEL
ncbi:type II secretion system major pseudopilin GspG [Microbulbifer sp. CAU 1566]|uniref:type II secretion system major pseudopilin GspG n=1 Tax=unclassified Microbulbifer TaxID=2619833 RepID=UPI00135BACBF|nr:MULTISPECIES: type II secretion system major pseudopilin GspG [unclassified Microbulbifer]MCK7596735.1 type II secretion system major pseudopilin GspG [Microbulbifer sp. CAU 1566]